MGSAAGAVVILAMIVARPALFPGAPVELVLGFALICMAVLVVSAVGLAVWRATVAAAQERRRQLTGHLRCADCGTLGEFGTVCMRCGALHPLPEEAGIHPVYGTWPDEGGPPAALARPKDPADRDARLLR